MLPPRPICQHTPRRRRAIEIELTIERLAAGGEGVARDAGGRVVFVPFTAPGDRVRVRLVEEKPRFARGRVVELLAPGASRCDPVCPVFGSCGGCAWQHVAYTAQLSAKAAIVEDALRRIGGIEPPGAVEIVPSPAPYGWRSRTRVFAERGRVGYRRRQSHALQAITRCPVLVPALDEALHALASDPPADGEIELAVGDAEVRRTAVSGESGIPPGPRIGFDCGGDRLEVSPGGFFQAHAGLRDALRDAALAAAGSGALAADAFAGAGFFTLGLARRFERVLALEAVPSAAEDLRHNARAAGLGNVEVLAAPVERSLARLCRAPVVLLDPPRTGLPRGAAEALAAGDTARLVYVSCDPAALARDLAVLAAGGLTLTRVTAFDLFPQTPHVEVLATLERRGVARPPASA
jgi:tRNA/tmRNA/rRNA uracil-C5-methylase (TrmA/RlmC/RlmD family)